MEIKPDKNKEEKADAAASVPKAEYEALLKKAAERDSFHDNYVRAHAEFDNLKKRLERERMEFLKYAKEDFVTEFMPIIDSIEMALKASKGSNDVKALHEGVSMIDLQVKKFLQGLGAEKIKTVGEKFDPHIHEAVETEATDDKLEDSIVEELKSGYRLNGKLIRPAAVKIVKHIEQKTENKDREQKKGG